MVGLEDDKQPRRSGQAKRGGRSEPGRLPWQSNNGGKDMQNNIEERRWEACGTYIWDHGHSQDPLVAETNFEADARLIASAPRLLTIAGELLDELLTNRAALYESISIRCEKESADPTDLVIVDEMDAVINRAVEVIGIAQGITTDESTGPDR